jgi:hypothetical protein
MTPLTLPSPASAERSRLMPVDLLRRQALERLYMRRETVDNLIRSLENYQRTKTAAPPPVCIEITARRTCRSNFAQSQI